MKTLLIDVGNSSLKWALCDGDTLSAQVPIQYADKTPIDVFKDILELHKSVCDEVMMVTVLGVKFAQQAKELGAQYQFSWNNIESIRQLGGITNAYIEPQKLGSDRFVGMIASQYLVNSSDQTNKAFIVVDSGTATTIDAVDQQGKHLGGVILPGLHLCANSLLDNTELLPLFNEASKTFSANCFSKETSQAIASGCLIGLAGAIDGICNRMEKEIIDNDQNKEQRLDKIICGGNAKHLMPYFQLDYQLQENLLMQGLKVINQL
ncbi:MAG: type III pantothenate kinase [Cocleimonas sp.]